MTGREDRAQYLQVGELHVDDGLDLGRDGFLDVLLHSPQHDGLQVRLQLLHLLRCAQAPILVQELVDVPEALRL